MLTIDNKNTFMPFKHLKNRGILLIAVSLIMILASCTDEKPNQSEENETINFLSNIMPDRNFSLIHESDDEFSFHMDDIFYKISESDENVSNFLIEKTVDLEIQRVLRVQRNNEMFYLNFSIEQNELSDYLLDSHANQTKPQKEIIQFYDSNFNLLGSSRTSDLGNKYDDVRLLSCTSDNVLGCMEDHCRDAGALLCFACFAGAKWCMTSLAAICAAEILLEYEREIYCEA